MASHQSASQEGASLTRGGRPVIRRRPGRRAGRDATRTATKAAARTGRKLLIAVGVKGRFWIGPVVLLLLVNAAATGASSRSAVAAASPSCGGVAGCAAAVTGSPRGVTAEQTANARAIGSVAVGLGERGPRRSQPTTERNTRHISAALTDRIRGLHRGGRDSASPERDTALPNGFKYLTACCRTNSA